jgi:hypothetical protein
MAERDRGWLRPSPRRRIAGLGTSQAHRPRSCVLRCLDPRVGLGVVRHINRRLRAALAGGDDRRCQSRLRNRRTLDVIDKLAALRCDPITGMALIAMNEKNPVELRGRMFAELAQYVAPKRKALEHSGDAGMIEALLARIDG